MTRLRRFGVGKAAATARPLVLLIDGAHGTGQRMNEPHDLHERRRLVEAAERLTNRADR